MQETFVCNLRCIPVHVKENGRKKLHITFPDLPKSVVYDPVTGKTSLKVQYLTKEDMRRGAEMFSQASSQAERETLAVKWLAETNPVIAKAISEQGPLNAS